MMGRLRGRSPRGERLIGYPYGPARAGSFQNESREAAISASAVNSGLRRCEGPRQPDKNKRNRPAIFPLLA